MSASDTALQSVAVHTTQAVMAPRTAEIPDASTCLSRVRNRPLLGMIVQQKDEKGKTEDVFALLPSPWSLATRPADSARGDQAQREQQMHQRRN